MTSIDPDLTPKSLDTYETCEMNAKYSDYLRFDVREALTKAKELLMKLEPEERFVVGTAYCGQNLRTGEILELVPSEDDLEIGGVKHGDYKEELLRIEPADFSSWPEGTPEHIFGDV